MHSNLDQTKFIQWHRNCYKAHIKNNIIMKKTAFLFILLLSFLGNAQETVKTVADQNTNHLKVAQKYLKNSSSITSLQGTTLQSTYKAIDPMEEKRERKKIRKDYRSQRFLWRHQERMERAKNSRNYTSRYSDYNYSPFFNYNSIYTLGLLSFILAD